MSTSTPPLILETVPSVTEKDSSGGANTSQSEGKRGEEEIH